MIEFLINMNEALVLTLSTFLKKALSPKSMCWKTGLWGVVLEGGGTFTRWLLGVLTSGLL
jgi:hypothetical protein